MLAYIIVIYYIIDQESELKQQFEQYEQQFASFTMIQPSRQSNARNIEKNRKKLIEAFTEFYLHVKLLKGFKVMLDCI